MKMNAGLMAFLGLLFAVVVGVFVIVPQLKERDTVGVSEQVSGTGVETGPVADPAADPAAPIVGTAEDGPASAATGQDSASEEGPVEVASLDQAVNRPSFDILRVEPDGSTVIAGKAAPGSTISIMNGETVIASTSVGPSGDFAAILDAPLEPGDYQLTLRSTGEDGVVGESDEVATVSIPETAEGELLAMVTTPGKASRIIAQPAAPAQATAPAAESAASGQAEDTMSDAAEAPVAEPADGNMAGTASAPEAQTSGTETPDDGTQESAVAAASGPDGPAGASGDGASGDMPELPQVSSLLTTTAPEIETQEATDAPAAQAGSDPSDSQTGVSVSAGADGAPAENSAQEGQTELAAVSPEADSGAAPQVPGAATVRVDAVEIEGDRIFIAGSATPGFPVRVSANGEVIGTDIADATGRFIIEAEAGLPVGDHTIIADLMAPDGASILLRASVPFNRPEGDALAAVAPKTSEAGTKTSRVTGDDAGSDAATTPGQEAVASADAETTESDAVASGPDDAAAGDMLNASADGSDPGGLILPDIASLSQMREDAFEALSALEQMVSDETLADSSTVASARDAAVAKLRMASKAVLGADAGTDARAIAKSMRAQSEAALAALEEGDTQDSAATVSGDAAQDDLADMRKKLIRARTALSQPTEDLIAAADQTLPAGGDPATEPRTIVQEPLASAPGAVIIRRGDTLWQISRRTYGQGVRYTTIYLANRSQIQDPDQIQPGQVFSVPVTPLENAEELHRDRLKGGPLR